MKIRLLPAVVLGVTLILGGALAYLPGPNSRLVDVGVGVLTGSVVGVFIWAMERSEAERMHDLNERLSTRDREMQQHWNREQEENRRRADAANQRLSVQAMVMGKEELAGVLLSNQDLSGMFFAGREIIRADFEASLLDRADFAGAYLRYVTFRDCRLRDASFRGATLESVDFSGADLEGCDFEGVSGCEVNIEAVSGLSAETVERLRELGTA